MECLHCAGPVIGRAGKKFCSDRCRNLYNYGRVKDAANHIRNTNNALKRNRAILEGLYKAGKTHTTKQALTDTGYNFGLLTSYSVSKTGRTYYYCYDYGYMSETEIVFIVMRK